MPMSVPYYAWTRHKTHSQEPTFIHRCFWVKIPWIFNKYYLILHRIRCSGTRLLLPPCLNFDATLKNAHKFRAKNSLVSILASLHCTEFKMAVWCQQRQWACVVWVWRDISIVGGLHSHSNMHRALGLRCEQAGTAVPVLGGEWRCARRSRYTGTWWWNG